MKKEINKPLCIIPARGGSKRLKNKGLALLDGKPLVEHAIEAAVGSGIFLHIIVTCDDEAVLEIAYDHFNDGLVQPHKRSPNLARSDIPLREVCLWILRTYDTNSKEFCLLIPNSPFRTAEDIKKTYKLFKKKNANYLISVKPFDAHPQMALRMKNGYLKPRWGKANEQSYEQLYYEDGAICWADTRAFVEEFQANFYGSKCLPYIMPHPTLEIHTPEDLEYAEYLWKKLKIK